MRPNSVPFICHRASHFRKGFHETLRTTKILSFTTYAASRLLQMPRGLEPKSRVYKALTELARSYLRADIHCIAKWTVKYGLVAASDELQTTTPKAVLKRPPVRDLLLVMETLLLEYLSQNWDSVDEIISLNRQHSGLRKPSRPLITKWTDPSKRRALKNWQKAYRLAIREIIVRSLGVQRRILTLSQTFSKLKATPQSSSFLQAKHPFSKTKRRPVLLMLGGGMAAGKSTIRERIKSGAIRTQIRKDATVIEADAIKDQDIVYKALKERLGDDSDLSPLVHDFSTSLAEEMLVQAVNQQQDIVFDGTMTWFPFVEQTIKMIRDYKHNYKRGLGYSQTLSGQVVESYWEIDETMDSEIEDKLPYRIEVVGVTCDPGLAVARGVWRRIRTGRSVPIKNQLRSHRLFSQNFEAIAKLVESAVLYYTGDNLTTFNHSNDDLEPLRVVCRCDSTTEGRLLVDRKGWQEFTRNKCLNDTANSVLALYSDQESLGCSL